MILHKHKPSELLIISFAGFLLITVLFFHNRIPDIYRLLLLYSSIIIIQIVFLKITVKKGFLEYVKDLIFPIVCVVLFFDSLEYIVHYINPHDIDPLLIKLDYFLFGLYPTLLMERFMNPFFTEILQFAYISYYFMPVVLGIVVKLRKEEDAFRHSIFLILLCFFFSYIGYMLFPALGPRYIMNHLQTKPLEGIWIYNDIYMILNKLEGIKRDAFPSGHTAVALTVLTVAYRYEKSLFYLFTPIVLLLLISTVYWRYHYVVDILGGIVLFAASLKIGDTYYNWWRKSYRIAH